VCAFLFALTDINTYMRLECKYDVDPLLSMIKPREEAKSKHGVKEIMSSFFDALQLSILSNRDLKAEKNVILMSDEFAVFCSGRLHYLMLPLCAYWR